jgi:hypothetical protein
LTSPEDSPDRIYLNIFKPLRFDGFMENLISDLSAYPDLSSLTESDLKRFISDSDRKVELTLGIGQNLNQNFKIKRISDIQYHIHLGQGKYPEYREALLEAVHEIPVLRGITLKDLNRLQGETSSRSFFLLFLVSLVLVGLFIIALSLNNRKNEAGRPSRPAQLPTILLPLIIVGLWVLPGLSILGRIICTVIYLSIMSLLIIDKSDTAKFIDHAKFLLMIFLYSGFWILYFQMFDSVLWYVQAYVDAGSLNAAINSFLGLFGIHINWFFDVEHVTVINAGTIIILQLLISNIVKKRKALPTMITGIGIGTIGMSILAISTNIWVFIAGIVLFSIGEMTAHPKFISYIGLVAPTRNKAMYMGYLFLYGVFGSSIGGIVGAKLYVYFVDNLNQPRVLWLIFSSIGVVTILCLLLYNKFLAPKKT